MPTFLNGYRALDLTDIKGYFCGKFLADLGVDVIKIERLGGDSGRGVGPFYGDIPSPERSLTWFALNIGKRSVTLDIESVRGRQILKALIENSDFVIESFSPGYMASLGLDFDELSKINPRIILTSITPFGQSGPYKDYKCPGIVAMAMGGYMYYCGDPDRAPVRITAPQAYLRASLDATLGTLIAHYYRETTGEGQHVDVSTQESIVLTMMNASLFWDVNRTILQRAGPFRVGLTSKQRQRQIWQCKDGFVCFTVDGTRAGLISNQNLVQWMDSEGMADEYLKTIAWGKLDMAEVPSDFHQRIEEPISRFFAKYTKAELFEGARKRHIVLYPVSTVEDLVQNAQLIGRNFWVDIEHPELNTSITYPGPLIKASEVHLKTGPRAPLIGEHNDEVYCKELRLSKEEIRILSETGII